MTTIRLPLHPATNAPFEAACQAAGCAGDADASVEAFCAAMAAAATGSAAAMQELTEAFETAMAAVGELIDAAPEPTLRERLANRFWGTDLGADRPQLDGILIPPPDTPAGRMLAWSVRRHAPGAAA